MSYWLNAAHGGTTNGNTNSMHMHMPPQETSVSPESLAWTKGPWGPGAIASPSDPGSPASPDAVARPPLSPLPLPTQLPSPPEQQQAFVQQHHGRGGGGGGRVGGGGNGAPGGNGALRLLSPPPSSSNACPFDVVERRAVSDGRRASKTDKTVLSWHTPHCRFSLAHWPSPLSLQRSISLAVGLGRRLCHFDANAAENHPLPYSPPHSPTATDTESGRLLTRPTLCSLEGEYRVGGHVSTRPAGLFHPWGTISCRKQLRLHTTLDNKRRLEFG